MASKYCISRDSQAWRVFLQLLHDQNLDTPWDEFDALIDQKLAEYNATNKPHGLDLLIVFADAESLSQFLLTFS